MEQRDRPEELRVVTGSFSGVELGFGFESNGAATSDHAYAEIGSERNGSFL